MSKTSILRFSTAKAKETSPFAFTVYKETDKEKRKNEDFPLLLVPEAALLVGGKNTAVED